MTFFPNPKGENNNEKPQNVFAMIRDSCLTHQIQLGTSPKDRMPLVSVLLPTYRSQRFLRSAIDSILAQTLADFEFIIILDGADDPTWAIVTEYAARDSRIQVVDNGQNLGVGASYIKFLEMARGEYLAQIGHDDLWAPNFLEVMAENLRSRPNAAAAFSEVKVINEADDVLVDTVLFAPEQLSEKSNLEQVKELFSGNFLCASSSLVRRSRLSRLPTPGPVDQLQDWMTWLACGASGELLYVPQRLGAYRVHGSNLSLGGARPRQLARELALGRAAFIASTAFAELVSASAMPNDELQYFLNAFCSHHTALEDLSYLELALRQQFSQFGSMPAYKRTIACLYWADGQFSLSMRYGDVKQGDTALNLGRTLRIILIGRLSRFSEDLTAQAFSRVSFGPVHCLSFRFGKACVRSWQFAISIRAENSALAAERVIQRAFSEGGLRSGFRRLLQLIRPQRTGRMKRQ